MLDFRKNSLTIVVVAAPVACVLAAFIFFDTLGKYVPDWAPSWTGLSLKAGSQFTLEVDSASLNEELLKEVIFILRDKRVAPVRAVQVSDEGVEVVLPDAIQPTGLAQIAGYYGKSEEVIVRNGEGGTIRVSYTAARLAHRRREVAEQSSRIIETRLSGLGGFRLSNPRGFRLSVLPLSEGRILVQVSQAGEISHLINFAMKPANLQFRLVNSRVDMEKALSGSLPEYEVLYSPQSEGNKPVVLEKRVRLSSRDFEDVQPRLDQRTAKPVVSFRSNSNGARKLAEATFDNTGRSIAVVFDNEIISTLLVREPISGGHGQISGDFTEQAVNELAILLRAGPLPVKLKIVEQ